MLKQFTCDGFASHQSGTKIEFVIENLVNLLVFNLLEILLGASPMGSQLYLHCIEKSSNDSHHPVPTINGNLSMASEYNNNLKFKHSTSQSLVSLFHAIGQFLPSVNMRFLKNILSSIIVDECYYHL
jgi:hypothetical protein